MYCTIHYINEHESVNNELSECVYDYDNEINSVRLFVSKCLHLAEETCIRNGFFYSYSDVFFDVNSDSFKCMVYNCDASTIGKVYVNNIGDSGDIMDEELTHFLDLTMVGANSDSNNIERLLNKLILFLESKHISVEYISHYFVLNNSKLKTVDLVVIVKVIKKVSNNFVIKIIGWGIYNELFSQYYKYAYDVTRQSIYNFLNDINAFFAYIPYSVNVHTYVSTFKKENHFVLDFITKCKSINIQSEYTYQPTIRAMSIASHKAECINYELCKEYTFLMHYFNIFVVKGNMFAPQNSGIFSNKVSRNILIKLTYPIKFNWHISSGMFASSNKSISNYPFSNLLKPFVCLQAGINILKDESAVFMFMIGGSASCYCSYNSSKDIIRGILKQSYFDIMAHLSLSARGVIVGYSHNCVYDESGHILPLSEYISGNDQYFIQYSSGLKIRLEIQSYIHAFRHNHYDHDGITDKVNVTSLSFSFKNIVASTCIANSSSRGSSYHENFLFKLGLKSSKLGKYIDISSSVVIMSGIQNTIGLEGGIKIMY